jgi:hypothetical protein
LIVGYDYPDHEGAGSRGNRARTVKPLPGLAPAFSVPP